VLRPEALLMKRSLANFSIFISLILMMVMSASAQSRGTWTIDREGMHEAGKVHLTLVHSHKNNFGQDMALANLKGLDAHALETDGPVKFQLQREAGTIQFEGTFKNGVGTGTYEFAANADFVAKMNKMGFNGVEKEGLSLTMVDVTIAYVEELRSLGFQPDLDHVISGRIFNVNRQQVEGLKAAGITGLSLDKLVECRIFNVNPDFVREMRAKNPNVTVDQLVEARIFKTTPEFVFAMKQEGYENLSQEQLTAFKIHNVTPEYIKEMRALGFKNLTADQLVEFRIFNVGGDQIRDLSKEGYKDLTAEQLVAFRIHNIDSKFIEKVKKAGYSHPSPDQLVEFKIMGLHKAQADI
jgi:cold shock CspA family protein